MPSSQQPAIMKLLRLPKLRRRDEEEDIDEEDMHGVKSSAGTHDLVSSEKIDDTEALHMSLPKTTNFWGTSMAYFLSPGGLTAERVSPIGKSYNDLESTASPTAGSEHDSDSEHCGVSGEIPKEDLAREGNTSEDCDERTCRQDEKAEIKLSGEIYPLYSLNKMLQSHKLADFSTCGSKEPGSLQAIMQKYGLSPIVRSSGPADNAMGNSQEASGTKQKNGLMGKMAALPLWNKKYNMGNKKASKRFEAKTESGIPTEEPPQFSPKRKPLRLWAENRRAFTSMRRVDLKL